MQHQWLRPFVAILSWLSPTIFAASLDTNNIKALIDFDYVFPNIANCNEWVFKVVEKQKALNSLNVIRALSRLQAVFYDNANDTQTAKSALISAVNEYRFIPVCIIGMNNI